MNSQYDAAIIGGAVIGICSAYFLAEKGLKVVVLEKGEIASGCSQSNGGLIVPSHVVPLTMPCSVCHSGPLAESWSRSLYVKNGRMWIFHR